MSGTFAQVCGYHPNSGMANLAVSHEVQMRLAAAGIGYVRCPQETAQHVNASVAISFPVIGQPSIA